jgi:hypothetical protein
MSTTPRSLRTPLLAALALAAALAGVAHAGEPQPQGLYLGEVGPGNPVLVSLKPGTAANGARGQSVQGEYHYARGWSPDILALNGESGPDRRLELRETLVDTHDRATRTGTFRGHVAPDAGAISGTWSSADGRRKLAFNLARAAQWTTQSVKAEGGVRSCERPQFSDPRYAKVNRELAQACDYFLADGTQGPGTLSLAIDSMGQYMVAAVAYATSQGREQPPEVIAIDLGSDEPAMPDPAIRAVAVRP